MIIIYNLKDLGWNEYFDNNFKPFEKQGFTVARVFTEYTHIYKLYTEFGEISGEISGKMRYAAMDQDEFPSVGDWVVVTIRLDEKKATIHNILPRKSKFSRKVAGINTTEQIVASNIDTVFLVNALNRDFNIRRIERYLIMAWESGAKPVILLSKADVCTDIEEKVAETNVVAMGVPIHIVSTIDGRGLNELNQYLNPGETVALLGSSGVGKSTLLNYLAGKEVQITKEVRECDDRGRHTSTFREMFMLDSGAMIVDTPGMREMQMWGGSEGIEEAFTDIEELNTQCKFSNCNHKGEPGCAIKQAIANGLITEERVNSYSKLQKEIKFMENKQNIIAKIHENKKSKEYLKYKRGVK